MLTGYPNIIFQDRGPQFTADYFRFSCSQMGLVSKETPMQSHNSLGLCERYCSIIRRAYNKLKENSPSLNKETRLWLAVHAVNNTTGQDGLTSTILVHGAVPRIPLPNSNSLLLRQKAPLETMRTARQEMEIITAQPRMRLALKHKHGLRTHLVFKFGDKVRIWREELQKFTGPHIVHAYDNEKTVWVMTDTTRPFSTSMVRLIPPEQSDRTNKTTYTGDR